MKALRYILTLAVGAVITLTIISFLKQDNDTAVSDMAYQMNTASDPQAAGNPCDSVYYQPVAWGNPLITMPQTLTSGKRGSVNWWQVKLNASNYIDPTKYKQGVPPNWERVVIADSLLIMSNDTFYICRKIKL